MAKYKNNYTGISISRGYGRINVSKKLFKHLSCPRVMTFIQVADDWMRIYPDLKYGSGFSAEVQHAENVNGGYNTYINNAQLVYQIFSVFNIVRRDEYQFSPFYILEYGNDDGIPYVDICMNHFSDYKQ